MSDVIQFLWIGGEFSAFERLSIASFLHHGFDCHLYTYGEVEGVPVGTEIKDANAVLPESEIFTYAGGKLSGFANWFRWELLCERGGWWSDADMVCLRTFDIEDEVVFGLQFVDRANCALMRFPPGHEVCRFLRDNCRDPNRPLPYDRLDWRIRRFLRKYVFGNRRGHTRFGEWGPKGITAALRHFGLMALCKPEAWFYPVAPGDWETIFAEGSMELLDRNPETRTVHLWANMTKRRPGFDKDGRFPEASMFEELKRRYLS